MYVALLGRFASRDPVRYEGGRNLYNYCGDSPSVHVDPIGLRPLSFAFRAFIHKRFGTWVREPFPFGSLGYYFRTDMRDFGEAGSSRLFSEGSIESTEIGRVSSGNVVTDTGMSHRRHYSGSEWVVESRKATPSSQDWLYNDYDMRTDPTTCSTTVVVKASAGYPFIFLAPTIDYKVAFEFIVVAKDRVLIAVSGGHDAFPNYEAIADGGLLYTHDTTWGGPGTGLTWGHLLGQNLWFGPRKKTVTAKTPPCCGVSH